jgi:hypothetical protein
VFIVSIAAKFLASTVAWLKCSTPIINNFSITCSLGWFVKRVDAEPIGIFRTAADV